MHNIAKNEKGKFLHLFLSKSIVYFIFFLLCVLILVPVLFSTQRKARQEVLDNYENLLNQEMDGLDMEINNVLQIGHLLKADSCYRHLVSVAGTPTDPQTYMDMLELQEFLTSICLSHELYRDVYILFLNNPICISNHFVTEDYRKIYPSFFSGEEDSAEEWHARYFSDSVPFEIDGSAGFFSSYTSPDEYYALTFILNLSPHTVFAKQSVLVCSLDFSELVENIIPADDAGGSFVYISDSSGNIIASYNYPSASVEKHPGDFSVLSSRRLDSGYQVTLGLSKDFLNKSSYSPLPILKSYLQAGILLILLLSVFLAVRETVAMRRVARTASVLFPSSGSFTKKTNEYTYISNILTSSAANLSSLNQQVKTYALENLFLSDKKNDTEQIRTLFPESFHTCCVAIVSLCNYNAADSHTPIPLEEICGSNLDFPFISAYTNISELSLLILPSGSKTPDSVGIERSMKNVLNQLQEQTGQDAVIHIGISSVFSGLEHVREAYLQVQSTFHLLASEDVSGIYVYSEPQALIYQKTLDVSLLSKCYDGLLCGDLQSVTSFFDHIQSIIQNADYDRQESLQLLFSARQPLYNAYLEICAAEGINKLVEDITPPAMDLHAPIKKSFAQLQDFAYELCARIQSRKSTERSQLMDSILTFIRTNCFDPGFSVFSVTEVFPVSKSYILQFIKEETGKSFKTFVESVRIDQAEYLLKNSDKTNLQIAEECGFCSENTFYRAFSRRHGTTPAKWSEGFSSSAPDQ